MTTFLQINNKTFILDKPQILKLPKSLDVLIFLPPATNELILIHVSKDCVEVVVRNDAALAVSRFKTSQLGTAAMSQDMKNGAVSVIYYESIEIQRV